MNHSSRQRILLLGGTGFISSHVARALLDAGYAVTVVSRGTRPVPAGAESWIADRHEGDALARVLEGQRFDATIDFTAFDAADIERLLLIPYAALGRYVLISTGQTCLVTTAPRMPYVEEDSEFPLIPEPVPSSPDHAQWSYGVGKRRAEGAVLSLRQSHGVRAVVLRLPVILGDGDSSLRTWAYMQRLSDGGPILLPEGGVSPVRFLYVHDLSRFIGVLLASSPPRLAIYNLAQPDIVTVRDLVTRMAGIAGVTPRFVDVDDAMLASAGLDRTCSPYSGPWVSILDPARAAAEWGFLASRLDDYLPEVVRAHREHPPAVSHAGYARRAAEITLATRLSTSSE